MLKTLLITIGTLVVLFVGVGLLLPGTSRVDSSLFIEVPAARLYAEIADLKRWPRWTGYGATLGSDTRVDHPGKPSGVGQVARWSGSQGQATLTVTEADPGTGLRYDFAVANSPFRVVGGLVLEPGERGTRVTWFEKRDLGNDLFARWLNVSGILQDTMRQRFATDLGRLARLVEGDADPERRK